MDGMLVYIIGAATALFAYFWYRERNANKALKETLDLLQEGQVFLTQIEDFLKVIKETKKKVEETNKQEGQSPHKSKLH